jgi:hypothetical protein
MTVSPADEPMTGLKKIEGDRWEVKRSRKETTGLLGLFNISQEIAQNEGSLAGLNFGCDVCIFLIERGWLCLAAPHDPVS